MNTSAPTILTRKTNFQRQITKEFSNQKDFEDSKSEEICDKIFEYFLVIGKNSESSEAETLHWLPLENSFIESSQGRVVGNFAFPTGIKARKIRDNKIAEELKALLNTKLERNGKHFVFSLKSDIEKPSVKYRDRANYKREILYFSCVIIEELIEFDFLNGLYILQPRCYCLVSYFPCFDLHFRILFMAINRKITAERTLIDQKSDTYSQQLIRNKIMLGNMLSYADEIITQALGLSINSRQISFMSINYSFPAELCELDTNWFCPLLFSLISLDDFLFILYAILQETSVIFLSQNMDYLSSCVLGFQGLIRPYSWPHLITPILPLSLIEILESPMPLLAGIPKSLHSSVKKHSHLIVVELDNHDINTKVQRPSASGSKIFIPNIKNESLINSYKAFSNGPCYSPTNEQLLHCKKIIERIKNHIRGILVNLPIIQKFIDSNNIRDYDYIIQLLKEQGGEDLEFRNNFFDTQMCTNAIEEYYSIRSNNIGKSFELC